MTDTPTLTTGRLVLRGMVREDFAAFAEIWADASVASQVGVPPRGRSASWGAFLTNIGHWRMLGYGQWAVTDRETGAYLGQTGMFRAYRGFGAEFDDWPEAGWVLGSAAQGRGIGTEAVRAVHDWFDGAIGGATVAMIDRANAPSLRLAAGMGYRETGTAEAVPEVVLLRRDGR